MKRIIPLLLCLAVPVACDDSPTTVESEPPSEAMLSTFATMSAGPDGTYPCPESGEIVRTGEFNHDIDGNTVTTTWHTRMEHRSCAIRIDQLVLTTDGVITTDGIARRQLDAEPPDGLIESSAHQTGSLRWRSNEGYDRTCSIDVTLTTDPATNTHRMVGTLCGRSIDYKLTLPDLTG